MTILKCRSKLLWRWDVFIGMALLLNVLILLIVAAQRNTAFTEKQYPYQAVVWDEKKDLLHTVAVSDSISVLQTGVQAMPTTAGRQFSVSYRQRTNGRQVSGTTRSISILLRPDKPHVVIGYLTRGHAFHFDYDYGVPVPEPRWLDHMDRPVGGE